MRNASERGATAVLVAVLLVVLIGFVALVVDMGQMFRARGELQNACDAAALAGARELDRTTAGIGRARAAAVDFASRHEAVGTAVVLADADVIFGHWDTVARTFAPLPEGPATARVINAVRVVGRRDATGGSQVALFFAVLLGKSVANVDAAAIAIGGGPMQACGFPMVVADCTLDEPISEGRCAMCMTYQDNNSDNAGWTSFDEGSVGGPRIAALITDACFAEDGSVLVDPVTHECTGRCIRSELDDEIKANNGNLLNTGNNGFCRVIQRILTRGVAGGPAIPFVVRVPVLRSTGDTCDASQFSSYHEVAGYAAMEIFGAKCGNSDPGVIAASPPCPPPPSGKFIVAALRCDLEPEGVAGGGYFGVDARHVRLVR